MLCIWLQSCGQNSIRSCIRYRVETLQGDANQGDGKDLVYGQTEHQNASESEAGESPVRLQTEPQYEMEDINEANMVMNSECIVGGERFM